MGRRKQNKPRRLRPATWRTMEPQKMFQAIELATELAFERNAITVLELSGPNRLQTLTYSTLEDFFQRGMLRASINESCVCLPDVVELEGVLNGMPSLEPVATHTNHETGRSARVFICPSTQEIAKAAALALAHKESN